MHTHNQKNVSTPKPPKTQSAFTPAQLLVFFVRLLPAQSFAQLPALAGKTFYHRLFTPLVTLWYLLFQRLDHDHTLDAVVTDARAGGADHLNPKLSPGLASQSTGPYSDARQRLPCLALAQALILQGRNLIALSPLAQWKEFFVGLLDGSTVRLRPFQDIPQHFPPHSNQAYKRTYWCLMRVVVAFCCFTGAALDCALGSHHLSEQALACHILLRAQGRWLFIGDRNFGVFRIVQTAAATGHKLLVRLTRPRARKLLGKDLRPGDYAVNWRPSGSDQLQPDLPRKPIAGRLLVVDLRRPGFRSERLFLFTTLTDPVAYPLAELVRLYGLRWHIELNLRYVKAQMKAAQLEAHSAEMARKEWLANLMAYNLIRAAMLGAALHKGIPPLNLSFSACRRRVERWLRDRPRSQACLETSWARMLEELSHCRLPSRRKARPNEPRAQRYLRQPYRALVGSRAAARRKLRQNTVKS